MVVACEVVVGAAVVTAETDVAAVVSDELGEHAETTRPTITIAESVLRMSTTSFAVRSNHRRYGAPTQGKRTPPGSGGVDDRLGGDDTGGMKALTRSGIVLWIVGVLVVVTVGVALVLALRPPEQFEPGTPEAAIQGYFQAVVDSSRADAERFMTPELVQRCRADLNQIRDTADSLRVVIVDTKPEGSRMAVTVEITERSASSVFLGEPFTFRETLIVEQAGDVWLIAEAPWPVYCWEA